MSLNPVTVTSQNQKRSSIADLKSRAGKVGIQKVSETSVCLPLPCPTYQPVIRRSSEPRKKKKHCLDDDDDREFFSSPPPICVLPVRGH